MMSTKVPKSIGFQCEMKAGNALDGSLRPNNVSGCPLVRDPGMRLPYSVCSGVLLGSFTGRLALIVL